MHFFGAEVRRVREAAGMSGAELGALVPCDKATVSRVENGLTVPDEAFPIACDAAFPQMGGWFTRFYNDSQVWGEAFPPHSASSPTTRRKPRRSAGGSTRSCPDFCRPSWRTRPRSGAGARHDGPGVASHRASDRVQRRCVAEVHGRAEVAPQPTHRMARKGARLRAALFAFPVIPVAGAAGDTCA